MYRRYYRYNDPAPASILRRNPPTHTPIAPSAPKAEKAEKTSNFTDKLFKLAEKDDLILIGLLLLVLLEEDKKDIDFPMVLALLYLLLQK